MVPFSDIPVWKYTYFCSNIELRNQIVIFTCKLCLQTAKRVYKTQRTVYENVSILFNQEYEWVIFFEDHVYDWGKIKKTSPQTHTKITLKLPPPLPEL